MQFMWGLPSAMTSSQALGSEARPLHKRCHPQCPKPSACTTFTGVTCTMNRSVTQRDSADPCGFEHVPAALLPSDPNMYWRLTEEEESLVSQLTEVFRATELCGMHVGLTSAGSLCSDPVTGAFRQMTASVVTFFMAMPDFAALHPADQAAALRASVLPLVVLTNAFTAPLAAARTPDDTAVVGPDMTPPIASSSGPQEDPQEAARQGELVRRLGEFQRSLRPILRDDLATLVLVQCALVFDASVPGVSDRQAVSRRHDKYLILLKHYVESQCSYLFCWHYLEAMFSLMKSCKALAVSLTQQLDSWCAIVDPLIQRLYERVSDS